MHGCQTPHTHPLFTTDLWKYKSLIVTADEQNTGATHETRVGVDGYRDYDHSNP